MQAQNVHLIMQSKVIFANQVELNLTRFASGARACSLLTLCSQRDRQPVPSRLRVGGCTHGLLDIHLLFPAKIL